MARKQKQVWIDESLLEKVDKWAAQEAAKRQRPMTRTEALRILLKASLSKDEE